MCSCHVPALIPSTFSCLSCARSFGEVGCLLRDALEEEQLATPRTEWAPPPAPSSARSLTVLALEHATAATAKVTRGSGAAGSSGKGAAGRRRAVVDEDGDGQGSSGSSGDEEDGLQDQPLGRRLRAKAQPRLRRLKQITKAGESSGGSETEDASEEAEIEEESSEGDGDEEEEGGAGGRAKRARQEGGEAARKRARLQSGSSAVPPAERKAVQVEVQYREYTDKWVVYISGDCDVLRCCRLWAAVPETILKLAAAHLLLVCGTSTFFQCLCWWCLGLLAMRASLATCQLACTEISRVFDVPNACQPPLCSYHHSF